MTIQNLINLDDCWLVLYSDHEGETSIHYTKPVVLIHDKEGNSLDFYGVKASMFGIKLHPDATKWSICRISNGHDEILFSGSLPDCESIHEYPVGNDLDIVLTRYNQYLKFSLGLSYSKRKTRNAPPSRFAITRFN
jgi:hypothetical protein